MANIRMIDDLRPHKDYAGWYVFAEYKGLRYFISHTPYLSVAEEIAMDYLAAYSEAAFFTDNCWSK